MAHVIADWTPLGEDTFYRKLELYTMEWTEQVNLDDFKVAAASFGGPIALIKDDKKILKYQGKPLICIFSASGRPISTIKWQGGHVIHLAWSCDEHLLIVQDDGIVCIYDIFGNFQSTFSMGQEAKDTKVLQCKVFNNINVTSLAVLTTSFRIFVVNSIQDARTRRLPEIPGVDIPPSCWAIIPMERTKTQVPNSKFLVGKEAELYLLDAAEQHAQQQFIELSSPVKAYVEIAVSFDGTKIALFTSRGIIWIGSSDLQVKYCEFDTKYPSRPTQLLWCGLEAVLGYWDTNLIVIGMEKDWLNYSFESSVFLVSEIDGVRIISNTTHELLQKVPDVVRDIFRIGSMEPGAILLEALKEFQRKSHRADVYIRMIKDQLEVAVEECIQAAGHEYPTATQKLLLRAASFGKCFIPDLKSKLFVEMCQTLRVLNAVRDYTLGFPITHTQLQYLTMKVLLDRLVLHRHYCLAIRICQYLKIPDTEGASRILAHWACYKVKQNHLDEEQVALDIANKLGCTPGISYADIADKAGEFGRKQLAIKLLDFEPRASQQVPLLLKLGQDKQAMLKAIESGDTDLIYFVIHHLRDVLDVGQFQMEIRNFPAARALYMKYCKEQKPELLRDLHYQEDDYEAEAHCQVLESYRKTLRTDRRLQCLQAALNSYKKARNEFAAIQTEDQIRLMRHQLKLEEKFSQVFLDKSLHDTMFTLLLAKENRLAEELKKEFRVPEKRYYWMKISALGQLGHWSELDKIAKAKKSPIGYEPFVEICLKYNNHLEIKNYLQKVKTENKVEYYRKAGLLEEAANIAFELKDENALRMLQDRYKSTNRSLADKIQSMRNQLRVK